MRRLLAAAAVLAALAGCSSGAGTFAGGAGATDSRSPAEAMAAARAAVTSARTFHLRGDWTENDRDTVRLDMQIEGSAGGRGSLVLDGDLLELVWRGGDGYVRSAPGFLRKHGAGADQLEALDGKFVKVATSSEKLWRSGFRSVTDPAGFAEDWLTPAAGVADVGPKQFGGVDCRGLRFRTKLGTVATVFVPTTGPARPTFLELSGAFDGTMSFDAYDVPFDLKPPPADEVVLTAGS